MPTYYSTTPSPIGDLLITSVSTAEGETISGIFMEKHRHGPKRDSGWVKDAGKHREAHRQLAEYFDGERTAFDLPLAPAGTPFQSQVWKALLEIPFGRTESYGELAARIGRPGSARAVGSANGRNPISIVIPCHRVIGSSGELTGYGGGLPRKRWLLSHEGAAPASRQSSLHFR